MIKLLAFIRRRPGMEPDEFHAYWRDVHAPRFAESAALRPYLRRYELNHRLPGDYARERHPGEVAGPQWDGVAVQLSHAPHFVIRSSVRSSLGFSDRPCYPQELTDDPKYRDAAHRPQDPSGVRSV